MNFLSRIYKAIWKLSNKKIQLLKKTVKGLNKHKNGTQAHEKKTNIINH